MISLLITTPGRSGLLAKSLDRLRALTLPAQLVVVDDASSEEGALREVVAAFERDTGVPSHCIRNEESNGNCAAPRNLGLRACVEPRVVFACPECYFLSDVLAELGNAQGLAMVGTVYYGETDDDLARIEELELSGEGKANAPYAAIVDREALLAIGGWDENFVGWGGEDIDLILRLEQIGVERAWCDAKLLHQFHGDGGGVEKKMADANINSAYLYRKTCTHGLPKHVCTQVCAKSA